MRGQINRHILLTSSLLHDNAWHRCMGLFDAYYLCAHFPVDKDLAHAAASPQVKACAQFKVGSVPHVADCISNEPRCDWLQSQDVPEAEQAQATARAAMADDLNTPQATGSISAPLKVPSCSLNNACALTDARKETVQPLAPQQGTGGGFGG